MAFFPNQVMPKRLRRETSKEVDDSPLVYNARDYNIHHREIRSLQQFLVGVANQSGSDDTEVVTGGGSSGPSSDTSGGGEESGGISLISVLNRFVQVLDQTLNRGLMGQYAATVQTGGSIVIPPTVVRTTVGDLGTLDTTVVVPSTEGFPASGIITKFNALNTVELCTSGLPPGAGSRCAVGSLKMVGYEGLLPSGDSHATNQEFIRYTSKTATSFLGCTRSANGTTAQASTAAAPALVLNARATMALTHLFWGGSTLLTPNQFYLSHDAMLKVSAAALGPSSRTRLGDPVHDHIEIGYLLAIVANFEDINVEQLFSAE
jgi:hypothetical protein